MKALTMGRNAFNETGRYTYATIEYAGLLSFSMLKKGSTVVTDGVRKVTRPTAAAICWPYDFVKDRTVSVFSKKRHRENIKSLTEKLAQIEVRLAKIEKYGVAAPPGGADAARKQKELREDKRFVLKGILEETKALKEIE